MPAPNYASPVPGGTDPYQWWNADPQAGFWEYLRGQGLNGLDPVSQFAQRRYDSINNQYRADAARDPNMGFYDYLNGRGFDFRNEYQNASPDQRGDFSGRTTGARARWITPR